jgi:hypothetical protein
MYYNIDINDLVGQTIVSIDNLEYNSSCVYFNTEKYIFTMFHEPQCCESIYIDDICGDISDILNTPIIAAYESFKEKNFFSSKIGELSPHDNWTFYNIATVKGDLSIIWRGEQSNYSSFVEITKQNRE